MREPRIEQPQIALQTWTIRRELLRNAREVLSGIRRIGFKHLQVANIGRRSAEEFMEMCNASQLKIVGNYEPPLTSGYLNRLIDEIEARCAVFQSDSVIVMLDPVGRGTTEAYSEYAKLCSEAGKILRQGGITLCYHCYHYDLAPLENKTDAKSGLDILMEATPEEHLGLELNTYFVRKSGVPMERVLDKYGHRCKFIQVRDIDHEGRRATLGEGEMRWTELIELLQERCRPKWYVLEDDTEDALKSVEKGLHYWQENVALDKS